MILKVVQMKANRLVVEVQRGERTVADALRELSQLDENFYAANPNAEADGDSTFVCAEAAARIDSIGDNP